MTSVIKPTSPLYTSQKENDKKHARLYFQANALDFMSPSFLRDEVNNFAKYITNIEPL